MKFFKNLTIYLIILIVLISTTFELKTRSKSRSKLRMRTKHKTVKFLSRSENKFLSDLWAAPGSPKPKGANFLDSKVPVTAGGDFTNIFVEDWLRVSSPEFKNESKFPVFYYPNNGVGEALVTEGDYTRINEKFQDRPPNLNANGDWKPEPDAPPSRANFYFRLSDKYLYFSESKTCVNVLGSFRYIDDTLTAQIVSPTCFQLVSKHGEKYKYCAKNETNMKKFLCHIQEKLRFEIDHRCQENGNGTTPVEPAGRIEEKIITQPYILIPLARGECNESWTYKNLGNDWECLCKEGNL